MDTNVKSYKYKTANKIICIVLCIVTFFSSMLLGTMGVLTYQYGRSFNNRTINSNYMESGHFQDRFVSDVNGLVEGACAEKYKDDLRSKLQAQKDKVVDKAYKNYLEAKPYITARRDYSHDDGDGFITTQLAWEEYESQSIDISVAGRKTIDSFYVSNIEVYDNCFIYATESDTGERAYIEKLYDDFVEYSCINEYDYWDINYGHYRNSLRVYAQNGEQSVGNTIPLSSDDVRGYSSYLIFENGKLKYKGIPDDVADFVQTDVIYDDIRKDTTIIIGFVDFPTMTESIFDCRYWNDYYISLAKFNTIAYNASHSLALIAVCAVVLLIISFAAGFSYFKISGKKSSDGKAKTVFVDKIPIELHFLLTLAIATAFCCLWTLLFDPFVTEYSIVLMLIFAGCLTVLQMIVFELCSSVARCVQSEKGIKNYFITSKMLSGTGKLFNKAKALFSYKFGAMAKNTIVLAVLYFFCNAVLFAIIVFLYSVCEMPEIFFATLLLIFDIPINVYIISKVLKYIKNLDTIITAFSNKEEPDVDIEKLPKSLKTLADSMKYTNEELQTAVQKAVKDERLRSELITNVSHDLKTPLTSIITYVDLLSKCDIDDERAKEYIGVLDDKGAKLKRLIDDLIEASKVTSGNVSVNLTSINLSELCLQSTVEAQADFEKAGLELIVKNSDNPPIVTADGAKTFRIIENLLSNARKYSATGTRVYVEVYNTDTHGIFEVKNISAEPLDISPDELTERFVRGDKSRNQEGNGLGLSIAKELCRLQYGNLELIIDGDLFKARVKLPK